METQAPESPKPRNLILKITLAAIAIIVTAWFFFGSGYLDKKSNKASITIDLPSNLNESTELEKEASELQKEIHITTAEKRLQEMLITGEPIDIVVHASILADDYLKMNDIENYNKWKGIEKEVAKKAGGDLYQRWLKDNK